MVNSPFPSNLGEECRKAGRTLRSFTMPEKTNQLDSIIPHDLLRRAKGLVILTVIKAGFLFSGRVGFGVVVARLPDGSWSAPSGIGTGSFGAGLQIGAELTDFVIVLNNDAAVNAFCYGGNVALGGNLSVAAGPIGRNAEGSAMATIAATYSYSKTKGMFAGISLEGTVFLERRDSNHAFYGKMVSARQLLTGEIPPPAAGKPLYDALQLREEKGREAQEKVWADTDAYAGDGQTAGAASSGASSYSSENTNATNYGTSSNPSSYPQSSRSSVSGGSNTQSYNAPPPVAAAPYRLPQPAATAAMAGPARPPVAPKPASLRASGASSPPPVVAPKPALRSNAMPSLPPRLPQAKALYDFDAQQPGDLGFKAGDVVEVIERTNSNNDWWKGRIGARTGSFPGNYVQML